MMKNYNPKLENSDDENEKKAERLSHYLIIAGFIALSALVFYFVGGNSGIGAAVKASIQGNKGLVGDAGARHAFGSRMNQDSIKFSRLKQDLSVNGEVRAFEGELLSDHAYTDSDLRLKQKAEEHKWRFSVKSSIEAIQIPKVNNPNVGLILTGAGFNSDLFTYAMDVLPNWVAISVNPYSKPSDQILEKAVKQNREIFVELPLQSKRGSQVDAGPLLLSTEQSERTNLFHLRQVLAAHSYATGVVNVSGDGFAQDADALEPIIEHLAKEGKIIIDATGHRLSKVMPLANKYNLQSTDSQMIIKDSDLRFQFAMKQKQLHQRARFTGKSLIAAPISYKNIDRIASIMQSWDELGYNVGAVSNLLSAKTTQFSQNEMK